MGKERKGRGSTQVARTGLLPLSYAPGRPSRGTPGRRAPPPRRGGGAGTRNDSDCSPHPLFPDPPLLTRPFGRRKKKVSLSRRSSPRHLPTHTRDHPHPTHRTHRG